MPPKKIEVSPAAADDSDDEDDDLGEVPAAPGDTVDDDDDDDEPPPFDPLEVSTIPRQRGEVADQIHLPVNNHTFL